MARGVLLVISGPSGAGKGTVVGNILTKTNDIKLSVSVTTRKPREGEIDGVNYHFKNIAEVEEMIHNDELLEYMEVYGNYYGTNKKFVENMLNDGYNVILEIDTKGALRVKEILPEAVLVFILPPSLEVLKDRLVGRGTETAEQVARRFGEAKSEIAKADRYDYVVINDIVSECADRIIDIVNVEKLSSARNKALLESFE